MHPDAMLLAPWLVLEAELSALPPTNPHGEAPVTRAGSSTYLLASGDERPQYEEIRGKRLEVWMKARVLGTIEVGQGRAVDRGRASGGVKDHRGQWTSKDRMNSAILSIWKKRDGMRDRAQSPECANGCNFIAVLEWYQLLST
ncbi:hypothetical protein JB92DRAFT_3037702 [Gautieria morchelliformis]|nr:hypothetical protein JB92DRAFT_3037702 [Gautieria morchelliformis]